MLFKNLARPPQRLPQRPIFRRQTLILIAGVFFFIFIVPTLFLRVSCCLPNGNLVRGPND